MAATRSFLSPSAAPGSPRRRRTPQPSPSNHSTTGISAAPVCSASAAGPRHHPGLLAEEVHLDAVPGDVAVTGQADALPRPQPPGQYPEWLGPPAGGQHFHAQSLAERQEPLVEGLRLEPLHDRRERACPAGDDPCSGLIPVSHVRQREDHAAAGRQMSSAACTSPWRLSCHAREAARPASPAAGKPPASNGHRSASTPATPPARSAPVASGPSTRRRLPSSTWTDGPWRRQATSAEEVERAGGRRPRAAGTGPGPAQAVAHADQPVLKPAIRATSSGTGRGAARRGIADRGGGAAADRRTASTRCPKVTALTAASSHSPREGHTGRPARTDLWRQAR